jgi:hypothetical protein
MREGRVCVGGHEMESFRSLRLLGSDGRNQAEDSPMEIGDVWELMTEEHDRIVPPHVEDIRVISGHRTDRIDDLSDYLGRAVTAWVGGPYTLFDGCLRATAAGAAYVPVEGPLPGMSTGYWRPDSRLTLQTSFEKPRYRYARDNPISRISYVGVAAPDLMIASDSLVRVSLSHPFKPGEDQPEGYWLQISGSYGAS